MSVVIFLCKSVEMFKHLFFLSCIIVVAASCLKSSTQRTCAYPSVVITAPQHEQDSLKAWLDSNHVSAVKHPSGFYYQIVNTGTGEDTMTLCSEILINYTGQFKSGQVFDQGNNIYLVLGGLIEGWKKGIPLIKKGGEIKLYVPPSLAYGNEDYKPNGTVLIPGKSTLIFDVKLLDYSPGY